MTTDFIDDGWSIKRLIRRIVLSHVYRISSRHDERGFVHDPENRLLWRAHRKRLPSEAIRDSMLAISGRMDSAPQQSPVVGLGTLVTVNNPNAAAYKGQEANVRSVYMPVIRNEIPAIMAVFDFADPDLVTGKRNVTTVPAQALLFLNSPFVQTAASDAAQLLLEHDAPSDAERLQVAYTRLLGRRATDVESERALQYIGDHVASAGDRAEHRRLATKEAWSQFVQAMFGSTEFRMLD